jgi:hypothetical protein
MPHASTGAGLADVFGQAMAAVAAKAIETSRDRIVTVFAPMKPPPELSIL